MNNLMYFGRMLDKIRLHKRGELPSDYEANLGKGFDEECVEFLGVDYGELVQQVNAGKSDDEILAWCRSHGRERSAREVEIWNEFMRKRGWNDSVSPIVARRKGESGFAERDDIQTMFDYIDADEGRAVGSASPMPL